jgi:hypothetical protein
MSTINCPLETVELHINGVRFTPKTYISTINAIIAKKFDTSEQLKVLHLGIIFANGCYLSFSISYLHLRLILLSQ